MAWDIVYTYTRGVHVVQWHWYSYKLEGSTRSLVVLGEVFQEIIHVEL